MGNFISYELLSIVFNMSVTASAVIVFVLLARLLLKKAPKIFSYALWAVVLFRLLCPVSITTNLSLLGLFDAPVTETTTHTTAVEYIPQDVVHTPAPEVKLPVPGVNHAVNKALPQGEEQTAADPLEAPVVLATLVWLAGIGVLAVYSVVSLLRLRRKLVGAVPLRDNIYLADYIDSPFVMGISPPKIYLPSSLSEQEQGYIILHEQHHIRRGDHIMKALAFLALCVHWFNPLVWMAFVLSSKDMEMSCDEAVVKKLGEGIRADYSASLLSLATGRRIIAGTPLAFGEGDTKGRIKNLLNWKQPKLWITVTAAVACVAVVAACAANPGAELTTDNDDGQQVDISSQQLSAGSPKQGQYGTAEDISYYLELSAIGQEFQDMGLENKIGLLVEYEDLLDDYTLIARESTDGKSSYIVGSYNGDNLEESPLYGLYGIEYYMGEDDYIQVLYREDDSAAVDEAMAKQQMPTVGYHIEDSQLFFPNSPDVILIQPKDTDLSLDVALNRYLYTPNGRAYIADAASRGVDMCSRTEPFLYVYRISKSYGEIAERFPLTKAEASAILAEKRQTLTDGFGFAATLHMDDETVLFSEATGVPQSVLGLAVEKCDYRFADPSYIRSPILGAELDCDWLDTTLQANEADLPRLEEILKNAEFGVVGSCGYGARLTLSFTGGEKLTVFKGTDGCGSLVYGSYSGYTISDTEDIEFWKMFGLNPETKEPIKSSAEPLTAEELAWFNDWLEPIVRDKQGNDIGVNALSCFLTSYYDGVTELNFEEFMRYFPGDGSRTSETEFEALRGVDGWPFDWVESLEKMPVPVHKYPKRLVDLILSEYAGVSTADLNTEGVAYLPEYDAYYNYTSDFGPGMFVCTRGERDGDAIRLYSVNGTDLLTLRQVDDTSYQIVSLQRLESPAS